MVSGRRMKSPGQTRPYEQAWANANGVNACSIAIVPCQPLVGRKNRLGGISEIEGRARRTVRMVRWKTVGTPLLHLSQSPMEAHRSTRNTQAPRSEKPAAVDVVGARPG